MCSPSCAEWRDWSFPYPGKSAAESLLDEVARFGDVASKSPESAAFFAYAVARATFFATQAAGSLAYNAATSGTQDSSPIGKGLSIDSMARLYAEALVSFRQDLENVRAGLYRAPYDAQPVHSGGLHRQWNPLFIAGQAARFVTEANGTLARRSQRADTSVWLKSSPTMYPSYYQHTFHYQSDGWFSADSAEVYETSTETLFVGRQDSMQRHTLVPVSRYLQRRGPSTAGVRVLELACGTGRFATFARDTFPEADFTLLDLSPFYLEKARENNSYWEQLRAEDITKELNADGGSAQRSVGSCVLLHANAEDVPEPDASFDVVTSVYLFHELPLEARRNVFAEAARVLKPGGLFVVTDSIQKGDRPSVDATMGRFGDFAEPYYESYIMTDLGELGREVGLVPWQKEQCSSSKTVSFLKPDAPAEA